MCMSLSASTNAATATSTHTPAWTGSCPITSARAGGSGSRRGPGGGPFPAPGSSPLEPLETVYLGGGTPSLLPPDLATRLLDFIRSNFDLAPGVEVTLEANPASTDEAKLAAWQEGGVNRLNLGVQGFDGRALAVLVRRAA